MRTKKILAIVICLSMFMSLSSCGNKNSKTEGEFRIGIGQFAEHPSLDNCREGFLLGLREEGFEQGKNVTFRIDNAQTDGGFASQIFDNYVNNNMDMIVAIATPMAQMAYSRAKDKNIPVIFTAVTDPVAAELADEDGKPVGNITGTSDKLPVDLQLSLIHEMYPEAKRVGILYTTSEVNSLSSIDEYKYYASSYGIDIITQGISDASDMSLACDNILNKVDVMTNVTDNTVVASLPILLSKANEKNIPVFGSEIEQVKKGCIACMGLDYVELGKQTGRMAAKILRGEVEAKNLNYEIIESASLYVNSKVADNLNYIINQDIIDRANQVFNTIS